MSALISRRDVEAISAYLDGQLDQRDSARLEARLKTDAALRAALEEMQRTRAVLRAAPVRRAPRNYSLKPNMLPAKARLPRSYPVLRLASALASLLFVISFVGDLFRAPVPVLAPVAVTEAMEATEAMLLQSSAPEGAEEKLAAEAGPAADLTATVTGTPGLEMFMAPPAAPEESPLLTPEPDETLHAFAGVTAQDQPADDAERAAAQAQPVGRYALRVAQATFLAIALLTGLAALYVRRRAAG